VDERAAIVVPTIREENVLTFLDVWRNEFAAHVVIIVEDNPEPTFQVRGTNVKHYSWRDIDAELGKDSWIIPRRTDCVRSFGYLKAYQEQVDFIVTLDDDCYPAGDGFLRSHYSRLIAPAESDAWVSTGTGVMPRGIPYYNRTRKNECVLNHGLWSVIPDYDAITQLANSRFNQRFVANNAVLPKGVFFPMCGMNVALKPKVIPAFYFLLMGKHWPFDRFGDIWCGLFLKKICDHLGYAICSGEPIVEHRRASNVWANLRKELPGYEVNETLWNIVDSTVLSGSTVAECYAELAQKLTLAGEYWEKLRLAMSIWANLFPREADQTAETASAQCVEATPCHTGPAAALLFNSSSSREAT
jgi:reversibly glycosylated polypeptide / UDP-arabinopyranose mutase